MHDTTVIILYLQFIHCVQDWNLKLNVPCWNVEGWTLYVYSVPDTPDAYVLTFCYVGFVELSWF